MVTRDELLECSISSWYPKFEKHTFGTVLIPLPEQFVAWLLEDGVFVPASSSAFPARNKQDEYATEDDYKDWSSEEDENETSGAPPELPEFIAAIEAAIADLGGSVVPKLTWSVPKDAVWMAVGNTLRCHTADQILLLLKSSDRIAHDLSEALVQCCDDTTSTNKESTAAPPEGHVLALRKWYDLRPGREFRCFVINNQLIGISQRDVSRRYEELEAEESSIKERIETFHKDVVSKVKFVQKSFTYDCYVPSTAGALVKLIDFNPVGGTTASLLFEWEELLVENARNAGSGAGSATQVLENGRGGAGRESSSLENGKEPVEFRIIREDVALRPDTALYGVPFDFVDMSEGSALTALMEQAQRGNIGGPEI